MRPVRRAAPRLRQSRQVDQGAPRTHSSSNKLTLTGSQIWDLRTGAISDTIRYDHPITGLQFDSRKIVAAAGENGVRVSLPSPSTLNTDADLIFKQTFNRTTLQHSTLSINGHTSPVERLRFMDRYLATGGRDCTVKIWALP